MQEYTVTLDNKSSEIKNVVKAESGEKYYILLEDRCIILEDKKDESIIITDGDKTYTLKYDSRLGYNHTEPA